MAPKKKVATADQSSDPPPKRAAMDRSTVSKMLGYLKYHAKLTNTDETDRSDAKVALDTYNQLGNVDKSTVLSKYEKNKGSLKWIHQFSTTSSDVEATKVFNYKIALSTYVASVLLCEECPPPIPM